MAILFYLIPISILILTLAVIAFIWAVKHDQFEDLDSPAHQILFEEKATVKPAKDTSSAGESECT